jgi:hemolysin D
MTQVNHNPKQTLSLDDFEQDVVFKQSPIWSRAIIWTIMAVATFGIGWASIAKIPQVVPATGQLKPSGKVKEVQAPINGVVKKVEVEEGDLVEEGDVLIIFDSEASQAELKSLQGILLSLQQENNFYQTLLNGSLNRAAMEAEIMRLNLAQNVYTLASNRLAIMAENQFFQALISGSAVNGNLDIEQISRFNATRSELNSRISAATLEVSQSEKQLEQNQVQLADARSQLATEDNILNKIEYAVQEGAIAQLQYERQKQQVESAKAKIDELIAEEKRLRDQISQGKAKLQNTGESYQKNIRDQLAENQKRLSEIDSQLTKIIVENSKKIDETKSQISQIQVTLKYQELKAPISGKVFDLKAHYGFVPKSGQAEPLLKIVPNDNLIAEVFIGNQHIGFVRENMPVDVRIDSFPFSEFGDIKGEIIYIGSDALPPDEINRFYRFPAKIALEKQYLPIKDRKVNLQSGMSVNVNINVDEDRTVLGLFTELFMKKWDNMKQAR